MFDYTSCHCCNASLVSLKNQTGMVSLSSCLPTQKGTTYRAKWASKNENKSTTSEITQDLQKFKITKSIQSVVLKTNVFMYGMLMWMWLATLKCNSWVVCTSYTLHQNGDNTDNRWIKTSLVAKLRRSRPGINCSNWYKWKHTKADRQLDQQKKTLFKTSKTQFHSFTHINSTNFDTVIVHH